MAAIRDGSKKEIALIKITVPKDCSNKNCNNKIWQYLMMAGIRDGNSKIIVIKDSSTL
jgi:hypothetical protein